MLAIPGQQEVYPVDRGCGHVKGIYESLARDSPRVHKTGSQVPDFAGDRQDRYVRKCGQPTLGSRGIPATRFSEDCLGNLESKSGSGGPPCMGDLLVSGDDNVSTWERRQVANNARLDIDLG